MLLSGILYISQYSYESYVIIVIIFFFLSINRIQFRTHSYVTRLPVSTPSNVINSITLQLEKNPVCVPYIINVCEKLRVLMRISIIEYYWLEDTFSKIVFWKSQLRFSPMNTITFPKKKIYNTWIIYNLWHVLFFFKFHKYLKFNCNIQLYLCKKDHYKIYHTYKLYYRGTLRCEHLYVHLNSVVVQSEDNTIVSMLNSNSSLYY